MGTPLLAVRDLKRSLDFYMQVLGLEVVSDFGANVVLTGGLSLQTLESWASFLGKNPSDIRFGGADAELYFTSEEYDSVLKALDGRADLELVRPPMEHRWGQRAVRLYDPDHHVIEVAEPLSQVCRRFRDGGLNEEGIARRMDVSVEFVREQLKKK
ncbi:VOC family protein [Oscillibacter sp.]|uniref:VOC family protein n=1 Tax=Oscillibacter sp. TaxID=1945593 RepID=UPI002603B61C|nr:VOC family protein [Oscillibacter sp.]MDD3346897.1 VOC family protein [Oscillibacter sp.]